MHEEISAPIFAIYQRSTSIAQWQVELASGDDFSRGQFLLPAICCSLKPKNYFC